MRKSAKFDGEAWSYHACTTPALTDYKCKNCQGRRCSPINRRAPDVTGEVGKSGSQIQTSTNDGNDKSENIRPRRPIIKDEDPYAEGVLFKPTQEIKNEPKIIF